MELRTCRNCKRLYNHFVGLNCCPACTEQIEETYRQVKEYVYDNPAVTIQEVADEFEISVKTIHNWIREEKLEFASASAVGLPCEKCGTIIKTGKYCSACKKDVLDNLSSAYKSEPIVVQQEHKKTDNRMRFLEH